jgi:hypothetical protein
LPRQARDERSKRFIWKDVSAGEVDPKTHFGAETDHFFIALFHKTDHFAKTGSGQTQGKLRTTCRFLSAGGPLSRHNQGIGVAPDSPDGKPRDGFWNDVREDEMWSEILVFFSHLYI